MAIDICLRVGRTIRELRMGKGWSQQLLADHAQIAREHVCRIEDGQKEMGLRTLERIARALDKEPEDLLHDPGPTTR
jgi:transcriptional regulator with XRE-family HTH domain